MIDDLIEKYSNKGIEEKFEQFRQIQRETITLQNEDGTLKAGDIVEFMGGYNNDIHFRSKILGFDGYGNVYVLWDCYWLAIDLWKRRIK